MRARFVSLIAGVVVLAGCSAAPAVPSTPAAGVSLVATLAPMSAPASPTIAPTFTVAPTPTTPAITSTPSTSTVEHPTSTAVPPTSTIALPSPATPNTPAPATRAALGAPISAFVSRLGQPNDHSGAQLLHYDRCPGSNVDGYIVTVADGRAFTITRQPCTTKVAGDQERLVEAATYVPADARKVKSFTTQDGEKAIEELSPSLGKVFPASVFQDCDGNTIPPGTFSLVMTSDGGWLLALGACP